MTVFSARRALLASGAALVLAASAIGIAAAQQSPTATPTSTPTAAPTATTRPNGQGGPSANGGSEAFLQALARRLNVSEDQLKQDIQGARQDAGLPANGGPGPFGGFPGGRRPGQQGGQPGAPGLGGLNILRQATQLVATTLNISPATLRQELPGHSLAQVAQNHGVSRDQLIAALTTAADQKITDAVTAGHLTADQGTQMQNQVAQQLPQLVDRVWPQAGQRPNGPRPTRTPTTTTTTGS